MYSRTIRDRNFEAYISVKKPIVSKKNYGMRLKF